MPPIPDWGLKAWHFLCLPGSCRELPWTVSA